MIIIVFIIAYLISWIIVGFNFIMAKKIVPAPLQCFTGSLGQGKTKIGVGQAIKHLKRQRIKYSLKMIKSDHIPMLYSNIPIVIKNSVLMRLFLRIFRKDGFITRSDMLDYIAKWQVAMGIINKPKEEVKV